MVIVKILGKKATCHLLNVVTESFVTVHIHHAHQLCERDDCQPCCSKRVKQRQPVLTRASAEDQTDEKTAIISIFGVSTVRLFIAPNFKICYFYSQLFIFSHSKI